MNRHPFPWSRRVTAWLGSLALVVALPAAAQTAVGEGPRMVYLPAAASSVDNDAIVAGFVAQGFNVEPIPANGRPPLDYAHRVASHVRLMMRQGVRPESISVVGAGSSSPVATLASALIGHRRVNYALLGGCDVLLKTQYRFRMSGRVLGVRDADDPGSHSCRPLWRESPKVTAPRDLVLHTGHGAALFDRPRPEWTKPVADWGRGAHVEVGRIGASTTAGTAPQPRPRRRLID